MNLQMLWYSHVSSLTEQRLNLWQHFLIAEPSQSLKPTNQLSTSQKATHPIMIWAPMWHPSQFPRSNWDKKHLFFLQLQTSSKTSARQPWRWQFHDGFSLTEDVPRLAWCMVFLGSMSHSVGWIYERPEKSSLMGNLWWSAFAAYCYCYCFSFKGYLVEEDDDASCSDDWWKQKGKAMNRWIHVLPLARRVVPFLVWRIAPAKLLRGRRGRTLQKLTLSSLYLSKAVVPTLNL